MTKKKKTSEKPFGLDMDFEKALKKYSEVTKEELQEAESNSAELLQEGETQTVLFQKKELRQTFHDGEWYFSIVDVIEALTGSKRPRQYWTDLKRKLTDTEDFSELYEKIVQLPMPSSDGKNYKTDVVDTETLFRIVQSILSKKAEPFKRWLAKVGYERIQEIQDPEIAIKRAMLTYEAKGYPKEWVQARVQTIVSRKELTHEWSKRGVKEGKEYAILTNVISKGTFGVMTQDHKSYKNLKDHHNLRDHMSPLELALTMLGETTTAELARNLNAQGFRQNEQTAKTGGEVAGKARKDIENKLRKPVVSKENYLPQSKQRKLKKKKN